MHSSRNKCSSCLTQCPWRAGPDGPKTLCDACGARYIRRQLRVYKVPNGKLSAKHSPCASPVQILRFIQGDPLRPVVKILPRGPINVMCSACGSSCSLSWRNGPDGPQTLCERCAMKYGNFKLSLYQVGGALVSAKPSPGACEVRHVGFLCNSRGRKDFIHPTVVPLQRASPPTDTDAQPSTISA